MNRSNIKALLIISLAILATGCKLALTVTSGGDVTSITGTRDCAGGSLCEYEVTDTTFVDSFTAVPRAGYVFSKWQGGAGYLCADSTNPTCTVSNSLIESLDGAVREIADTIVASGTYYYAQPLFTFVGIDTDEDGIKDYLDPDDDNDGVLDADDNCPLEGPNLDGFGCSPKTVFVTSESYTGNLGGLAGADQKCNDLAAAAGLSGTYKAWLSDSSASPDTRFTRSAEPYTLVDGTVVASDYNDLVNGSLLAPIDVTEVGDSISGFTKVWTFTFSSGQSAVEATQACSGPPGGADWTADNSIYLSGVGRVGDTAYSGWSYYGTQGCGQALPLYCFEQ